MPLTSGIVCAEEAPCSGRLGEMSMVLLPLDDPVLPLLDELLLQPAAARATAAVAAATAMVRLISLFLSVIWAGPGAGRSRLASTPALVRPRKPGFPGRVISCS